MQIETKILGPFVEQLDFGPESGVQMGIAAFMRQGTNCSL